MIILFSVYIWEKMYIKSLVLLALVIIISYYLKTKFFKSPRQMGIENALEMIFQIKKDHHDKIVIALEEGATEETHKLLLEEKSADVLQAIDDAEKLFDIVIDKTDPTKPGKLRLIKIN